MKKVLFIEQQNDHYEDCKRAFMIGADGSITDDEIGLVNDISEVSLLSEKPVMILRCYANELTMHISPASALYPNTLMVMPLKNQKFEDAALFMKKELPVIVTAGSSDASKNCNCTTFGNGIEFWDENILGDFTAASYAASFLAGKLFLIRQNLNCSWWEARYRAQVTAIRSEPNRLTSFWDYHNGYGRIEPRDACLFNGFIPKDPFLSNFSEIPGLLSVTNNNGNVRIVLESIPNAAGYNIYRNGELVHDGNQLVINDIIVRSNIPYTYTYRGYSASGSQTVISNPVTISFPLLGSLSTLQQMRLEGNLPGSVGDDVLQPFLDSATMEVKKLLTDILFKEIFDEPVTTSRRRECAKGEANLALSYAVHSLNIETTGNGIVKSKGWDESKSEMLNRTEIKDLSRYYRFTALNFLNPYLPSAPELNSITIGRQSLTVI